MLNESLIDMTTAEIIVNQLGNITLSMLGAYNLADTGKGLNLKIKGSRKVNCIGIELNANDTYDMTFYKLGRTSVKVVNQESDIYVDMLHKSIERNTGLYTKF